MKPVVKRISTLSEQKDLMFRRIWKSKRKLYRNNGRQQLPQKPLTKRKNPETYPGRDGITRVADIQTATGIYIAVNQDKKQEKKKEE